MLAIEDVEIGLMDLMNFGISREKYAILRNDFADFWVQILDFKW